MLIVIVSGGCSTSGRPQTGLTESLLFNPAGTGVGTPLVARTDWPSTPAYSSWDEQVAYRETIIDRQGQSGTGRDYTIRRFYSVRTGRVQR